MFPYNSASSILPPSLSKKKRKEKGRPLACTPLEELIGWNLGGCGFCRGRSGFRVSIFNKFKKKAQSCLNRCQFTQDLVLFLMGSLDSVVGINIVKSRSLSGVCCPYDSLSVLQKRGGLCWRKAGRWFPLHVLPREKMWISAGENARKNLWWRRDLGHIKEKATPEELKWERTLRENVVGKSPWAERDLYEENELENVRLPRMGVIKWKRGHVYCPGSRQNRGLSKKEKHVSKSNGKRTRYIEKENACVPGRNKKRLGHIIKSVYHMLREMRATQSLKEKDPSSPPLGVSLVLMRLEMSAGTSPTVFRGTRMQALKSVSFTGS